MNEFEIINRYFYGSRRGGKMAGDVVCGVGDDAAVLQLAPGRQLVVSVDTAVAGVHFPASAEPHLVAERAIRAALSDLAAMGAQPHWFTLALTLPKAEEAWLAGFSEGVARVAEHFECTLVGGDTTRGPLTVSVQVMGSVANGSALMRSGAREGDTVYVTGNLGDGAAALAVINNEFRADPETHRYLLDRFYRPQLRLDEAAWLVGLASAAIDISDGLLNDLGHICEASGVGARIDVEKLPVYPAVQVERQWEAWALSGGDDYELCFTVPPEKTGDLEQKILTGKIPATAIGTIVKGGTIECHRQGRPFVPATRGYQHFG